MNEGRIVLVDASVLITLAEIDRIPALVGVRGTLVVPESVENEITREPAACTLSQRVRSGDINVREVPGGPLSRAAIHLGKDDSASQERLDEEAAPEGDVGILGLALLRDHNRAIHGQPVVLTDDKPLRNACKALSIPVSGSIGVLVRAVERGDLDPDDAKAALVAMDEVGARLSASLMRKAERLIDDADGKSNDGST